MDKKSYLLIDADILPPVFAGVIRAKELLADGKLSTAQAVKEAGISRSAFFKYSGSGDTLSLNAQLSDRAGVFSALTAVLYGCGANIVTVSQGLPENGKANVSLTLSIGSEMSAGELINRLLETDGVISIKVIDGGKK